MPEPRDPSPSLAETEPQRDTFDDVLARVVAPERAAPLAAGTVLAERFRIVRALGAGGMGTVYLARDATLGRDVAIKLHHAAGGAVRLKREAIAMARLAHPNVVTVFEVGEVERRPFVVMEYIAGATLRTWAAAKPRTVRELLAMLVAAGEGLAAAHDAGLVHRDFKPENILIGDDGRARVSDFGLARDGDSSDQPRTQDPSNADALLSPMTMTGAVLGTPAYMAPEQFAGGVVDARSDQFAYCLTAWETLWGERPYAGNAFAELEAAISRGERREPPATPRVPRAVRAALERGLATEPTARFADMHALLAALRAVLVRRRAKRYAIATTAVLAVGLVGGTALFMRHDATTPCSQGSAQMAKVWNPQRSQALATAFEQSHLGQSWPAVRAIIDRYASTWVDGYRASCRAGRIDRSESEALLDRRMLCLNRARTRLDSLLTSFTTDRELAADAAMQSRQLSDPAECANSSALTQQAPLPQDPVLRARVDAAATVVDHALRDASRTWDRDAAAEGDAALDVARETGWAPLIADAMRVRAGFEPDAEKSAKQFRAAAAAAIAAGDDRVAAWAFADAGWAISNNPTEAEAMLEQARALWTRLGKPPDLGNRIETADSERLEHAGDPVAAVEAVRRANKLSELAFPDFPIDRAADQFNLAKALDRAGDFDQAQKELDAAIAAASQVNGESHPQVASYLALASEIAQHRGQLDEGVNYARRALAIDEAWYGKADPRIASSLAILGQLLDLSGHTDEARQVLERALTLAGDEMQRNNAQFGLGMLEESSGHHERAIELWSDELQRAERISGAENAEHAHIMLGLGIAHRALGHLADSHQYLAHALELETAALGATAPQTVNDQLELSYTLVAEHHAADATKLLEPSLTVADLPPTVTAELHTAFGKALWATGDHDRAKREVMKGRDAYAALGDAFSAERAKADAWLAKPSSL